MAIQMFDKKGNSKIVENQEVQTMLKSGWSFHKPAVKILTGKKTKTTRPKASLSITKAEAEVIKPTKENDNGD